MTRLRSIAGLLLLMGGMSLSASPASAQTRPAPDKTTLTDPKRDAVAGKTLRDSVQIATAGPVRGDSYCKAWDFAPDSGQTNSVLSISLVDTIVSTLESGKTATTSKPLAFYLDDRPIGVIAPNTGHADIPLPTSMLNGSVLTVLYGKPADGTRWYCSIRMREPAKATAKSADSDKKLMADPSMYIATGVEFASADGFQSKQVRVPVVAKWAGDLKSADRFRISFVSGGEAGAVSIPQHFSACLGTRGSPVTAADTLSDNAAVRAATCRVRHVDRATDSMFVLTSYSNRADTLRQDSTATTGLSWRLSGLLRIEFDPFKNSMYFGIPLFGAFQTNPAGAFNRSIGQSWRTGITFRQLDAAGHEKFEAQGLYGVSDRFSQTTTTSYALPLSKTDTTVTSLVTRDIQKDVPGWLIRGYFQPVDGFMLRAVVEIDHNHGNLATISILKTLDVSAALKALGIQ